MKTLAFRLKPGDLLKEEIERRCSEAKLTAGVLLSIVGALSVARLRMAGATPEKEEVKDFTGHFEIVSGTGTISNEDCHIHISISNAEGRVFGGHLKDGCVVEVTAEVVIGIIDDHTFTRAYDDEVGYKILAVDV